MVSDFRPRESYQFFLQESVELLQTLEQGLLEIREDSSTQKIHNLMRTAHSIKGGAACVGLNHIKKIAHNLENVFKTLYKEHIVIDLELEELLLQAYDRLKSPLIDEIHYGGSDEAEAIANSTEVWQQIEAKFNSHFKGTSTKVDLPFIGEINQGLERLEKILTYSNNTEILDALKLQIIIFRGLAEVSKMTEFLAIANRTLKRLENKSDLAQDIGQQALTDFRNAYQAIQEPKESNSTDSDSKLIHSTKSSNPLIITSEVASNINFADPKDKVTIRQSPIIEREKVADKKSLNQESIQDKSSLQNQFVVESSSAIAEKNKNNFDRASEEVKSSFGGHYLPHEPQSGAEGFQAGVISDSSSQDIAVNLNNTVTDNNHQLASVALGIRIDASRLELLHNLVGELVTQDNRFLLQNQQNRETLNSINQWFNRFKQLNQNLKLWIDRLPNDTGQSKLQSNRLSSHNQANQHLKTSLQTIMEELAQLGEGLQDLAFLDRGFDKILKTRQKTLKQLQNNLLKASMLPIGELLAQFPRMVRDVATREAKQVKLKLNGDKTLIDKAILEKLYDPLVHIVINAITHGLETPDLRRHKNKPSQGTVTISTYHQGNHTYIEIKDDGRGLDWDKIRHSVVNKGLLSAYDARKLSVEQLAEYLFNSGFSTADKVSTLAGRGMGLSAVKRHISSLKGTIQVNSKLDIGTTFTIRLPLTLTIIKLLVFSIAGNLLAIPVDCLLSIVLADKQDIQTDDLQQYYQWQGKQIQICPEALLSSYHYPRTVDPSKPLFGKDWQNSHKIPLLLLSNGMKIMALRIEQILMEQDLVIKPFDKAIAAPPSLIGCTVLGDGRLIPVLNSTALVDKWLQVSDTNLSLPPAIAFPTLPTILIVDDSLTIRQTLSNALRKAGYRVIQSRDGLEGVEQLKQEATIQAVISDIEMPRMNGLEFLGRARQLRGTSLPIIMLTSRGSDKYRQLADTLGATRYLTKPFVDKEVIATLEQCLYS